MTPTDLNNHLALIEEKCGFGVARELEAHIEALGTDAARYQYIRTELSGAQSFPGEIEVSFHLRKPNGMTLTLSAAGLDSYIDDLAEHDAAINDAARSAP